VISHDSFIELMHELGDADAAPAADGRLGAIHHRIRVVRVRRAATVIAAVIAVVLASFAIPALRPAPTPVPAHMPRSWTTSDGVTNRLVGVFTLDTGRRSSLTVRVPAGVPVTLRYACRPGPAARILDQRAQIAVGPGGADRGQYLQCQSSVLLADIDTSTLTRHGDDADLVVTARLTSGQIRPAVWTIGVYTWDFPAVPHAVRSAPPMPAIPGYRLATTRTAIWPDHTITFEIPAGTVWGTLMTCSDTFAGAYDMLHPNSNDDTLAETDNGVSYGRGGLECPARLTADAVPSYRPAAAVNTTVTLTIDLAPIYADRSGAIEVGVYYRN
jgi:hypothetical protein